jgi:hypothetical protein
MAIVEFDTAKFKEYYPQYSSLTDAQLNYAFRVASLIVNNTLYSKIPYDPTSGIYDRETLLYLLVCHLCELSLRGTDAVGSVASATEGSVSVSFSVPASADAGWYSQTQCGITAYQILSGMAVGGIYYDGCCG